MMVHIHDSWKQVLDEEFNKEYFKEIALKVKEEYKTKVIYPKAKNIFNAFNLCSFDNLKVVILGQDPYHGVNQAHGLSFSVQDGVRPPPSLVNIYKELETDLGQSVDKTNGNLERWAKQGILLLNATLTVVASKPNSHQYIGWQKFTDAVIQIISDKKDSVVFILWGANAQKKETIIDVNKHFVIKSSHPSPYSADRGFFGSKPFSRTNTYLKENKLDIIQW